MKIEYSKFKGFENIFLEDSFILKVSEKSNEIRFKMEIVLTEKHSMYSKPTLNEFHSYADAEIIFENVEEIIWTEKNLVPSEDASGEIDYGNIDAMYFENDYYYVFGDIGELKIKSSKPKIIYL